jgi:hypothetical protein
MNILKCAAAAAVMVLAIPAMPAFAEPTPGPTPTRLVIKLPNVPLHTEVVVEVNAKGQVVRVKSAKPSKLQSFNAQTYGNALQMWIRKCHTENKTTTCTADVGLYRVTYDYNPKTGNVTRRIALVSRGGSWANSPGAANIMMDMYRKQAEAAAQAEHEEEQRENKLPSLNEIRGVATPKPTHAPTLPP